MADYVDLDDVQVPTEDDPIEVAWGLQVRENFEFFYERKDGVKAAVTQDIPDVTLTPIDFSSGVQYDSSDDEMVSGTHIYIPRTGLWTFTVASSWGVATGGERRGHFYLNGNAGFLTSVGFAPTGSGLSEYTHTEPDREYVVGDYIEYVVEHSVGVTTGVSCHLSARWLST